MAVNVVTQNFSIENAKKFKAAIAGETSIMYLFISRIHPYADETVVPAQTDFVGDVDYNVWRDMIGLKKILPGGVSHGAKRHNWSNNVLYAQYDHTDTLLYSNNYFVLSSSNNVYKCLFNNGGANSTVQPSGTATTILNTADGYRWKFLYSISTTATEAFVATNYIPVNTLSADDSSVQWDVQQAAVNGAIQVVDITTGGSGYLSTSNTTIDAIVSNNTLIVGGTATHTLTLKSNASGTDDVYNGSVIRITGGLGIGQVREIVDYVGTTREATVNNAFTVTPNTTSDYVVTPKVTVTGDGSGATAYSNVVAGAISYVNMIAVGSNYSTADVTISANSSHGTGAIAKAMIPPHGGHGADPISELNGKNLIFNTTLTRSEANTLPIVNDYRRFGLIIDPKYQNGVSATALRLTQTTRLTLTSVSASGRFTEDTTLTGATSGATGAVVRFANTNAGNTTGIVHVTNTSATLFTSGENVTSSGANGVISANTKPDLKPFTGKVLYIENRQAITRSFDQDEDFKLVFTF